MKFAIPFTLCACALMWSCTDPEEQTSPAPPPSSVPAPAPALASPETSSVASAEVTSASADAPDVALALAVIPNKTQYVLGEPVQLYLLFNNLSERAISVRSNYFLDKALTVAITPAHGETWRFIDRLHTGVTVPNVTEIGPRESRGFYIFLAHSEVDNRGLPFPETGLYRIDTQVEVMLNESEDQIDTVRAEPITVNVVPPLTSEEREVHETFLQPQVAQSIQNMDAPDALKPLFDRVIDLAPESLFAEHAHFLRATIAMQRSEWLKSNEDLYPVYYREDGFYPKDFVLLNILSNFHYAEEPERALRVCNVLVELFPRVHLRRNPLVEHYTAQNASEAVQ